MILNYLLEKYNQQRAQITKRLRDLFEDGPVENFADEKIEMKFDWADSNFREAFVNRVFCGIKNFKRSLATASWVIAYVSVYSYINIIIIVFLFFILFIYLFFFF